MKINVPAEAFRQAALKRKRASGAEAEGSKKRPRSQSPSAPRSTPIVPTPSPPLRRSPTPVPPLQRPPTPLPPRRSPTPIPPSELLDLTGGTSPGTPSAPVVRSAEHPILPSSEPIQTEAPQAIGGASVSRRQKSATGHEARTTVPEPAGDKMGPIPLRPSLMNQPHVAEKLLGAASSSAIREELRRTNSRTVFRECQTALLRVVNVFHHTQSIVARKDQQLSRYHREATEHRERATKAEDNLKLTLAGEAERLEMVRSQARAETEAVRQQMHKALERAVTAEGKLMAAEAELTDVKTQLETAKSDLKVSEEKTEIAEEVARLADLKVAEATAATRVADRRSAEAESAARAAEKKVAEVAEKAIESYRNSQAFIDEVAEAGADAYLHGFNRCREEAARVFGIEGLKDFEPMEDRADEGIDQGSAPLNDAAPPASATPGDE